MSPEDALAISLMRLADDFDGNFPAVDEDEMPVPSSKGRWRCVPFDGDAGKGFVTMWEEEEAPK